jgi:PAS domain S-box-containing protein
MLDSLPCAAALWPHEQRNGTLNDQAIQLLGIASLDVSHATWVSRIDPRDRSRFIAAWERIKSHGETGYNDYRFLRSDGKSVWIREISGVYHNEAIEGIISTYTDISDLKKHSSSRKRKALNPDALEGVIGPLIHDIRNKLHAIRLEIDLLLMDFGATLKSERFFESVERVNRSLHDLREYLISSAPEFAAVDPTRVLDEILAPAKKEFERQRIHVKLDHPAGLPQVWSDPKQLRSALEHVVEFCRVLLDGGGNLGIDARIRHKDATDQLELALTTTSVSSCDVNESEVFRPFVKIKNRQIGLGMALAQQILRRNQGEISFSRDTPYRGRLSILLKLV